MQFHCSTVHFFTSLVVVCETKKGINCKRNLSDRIRYPSFGLFDQKANQTETLAPPLYKLGHDSHTVKLVI
jgi:hypothetical protein